MAIELAVKTSGSLIINDKGSLYLGSMNIWDKQFLETNKISHIINTADGLDKMFPSWGRKIKEYEEKMNLKVLNLHWMDESSQKIWESKIFFNFFNLFSLKYFFIIFLYFDSFDELNIKFRLNKLGISLGN